MLVDMTSSMSNSCCGGNVTIPGCCGIDQDDDDVTERRLAGSCCRVTSRLRLGWVTPEDEGLYTCSPAGLGSLGLEDRLYIHVIHSPVVEERWESSIVLTSLNSAYGVCQQCQSHSHMHSTFIQTDSILINHCPDQTLIIDIYPIKLNLLFNY